MRRIGLLTLIVLISIGIINAAEKQVTSPDGKLIVSVAADNGTPTYSVTLNGKQFLKQSPIGLKTNVGDFTQGLTVSETVAMNKIDNTYELPNIKQSKVHYQANESVFSFTKDGKAAIDIIFRVSNNNIALKYKVYPQRDRRACVVDEEVTGFLMPEGTTTFLCPQSKPMGGFARTTPS